MAGELEEKRLRRLLEKIEVSYLHKQPLKLSAAQKYIETFQELISIVEEIDFSDIESVFAALIKPLGLSLNHLIRRKDPDAIDVFFLEVIETFQQALSRISNPRERRNCTFMIIDIHKLRLAALSERSKESLSLTRAFFQDSLRSYCSDGGFWFQWAVVEANFGSSSTTAAKVDDLVYLSRALLARSRQVDSKHVLVLFGKFNFDFRDTLLSFVTKDFRNAIENSNSSKTWSFVKYFQTFTCASETRLHMNQMGQLCVFVFALYHVSHNEPFFATFLEALLSSKNEKLSHLWPFVAYCMLGLAQNDLFHPPDSLWLRLFQLLKNEELLFLDIFDSSSPDILRSFLLGSLLSVDEPDHLSASEYYDFEEEYSLERDRIVLAILKFFNVENGVFREFIALRHDKTFRLGAYFCQQEENGHEAGNCMLEKSPVSNTTADEDGGITVNKDNKSTAVNEQIREELDSSIERLKDRLSDLSTRASPEKDKVDYNTSVFILDANTLISVDSALRGELTHSPDKFLVPIVVLGELEYLAETSQTETSKMAQIAVDFANPLIAEGQLRVVNNFGRILRPEQLAQQKELLSIAMLSPRTRNDDRILEVCSLDNQNECEFGQLRRVLITEDVDLRLKAKGKQILAISLKEFRQICNR